MWTAFPLTEDPDARAEQEHRVLAERIAGWREKFPTVAVRLVVVHERPARALLEEAERAAAQLIVVGTRRLLGPAAGMGMGSTSRALHPALARYADIEVHNWQFGGRPS